MIDAMMDMIHSEQKVDVFEFVSRIRNQRPQMVQTDVSGTSSFPRPRHHRAPRCLRPTPWARLIFIVFVFCGYFVIALFCFIFTIPGIAPGLSCEFTLTLSSILSHLFTS